MRFDVDDDKATPPSAAAAAAAAADADATVDTKGEVTFCGHGRGGNSRAPLSPPLTLVSMSRMKLARDELEQLSTIADVRAR
jgi:hypothetical protein